MSLLVIGEWYDTIIYKYLRSIKIILKITVFLEIIIFLVKSGLSQVFYQKYINQYFCKSYAHLVQLFFLLLKRYTINFR